MARNNSVRSSLAVGGLTEGSRGKRQERRGNRLGKEEVVVELAHSETDLKSAYGLVYYRYLQKGYQSVTPQKLRFTAHCCLPSTYTFVARVKGQVVATSSLILDGVLGLPMEKEYPQEINNLRAQNRMLMEVSCLTTRRQGDRQVLMRLIRAMYAFAHYSLGVSDCCIAVHPDQRGFYERALLFDVIGEERDYDACSKAPAVALCLHLDDWEERMTIAHGKGMIGRFFVSDINYLQVSNGFFNLRSEAVAARYAFAKDQLTYRDMEGKIQRAIWTDFERWFEICGLGATA